MTPPDSVHSPASPSPTPARERELETGRLVERAVRARLGGEPGAPFLVARARADAERMEASGARQALLRAVEAISQPVPDRKALSCALAAWGGVLERHHHWRAAVAAFETALAARPRDPELMLHAARAHRKAGDRDAALALYGKVLRRGGGRLARFSRLGEALLGRAPEDGLARVLGEAEAARDQEVAAVALEERARLRRDAGRIRDAVADYTRAALRYEDRRDRLRIAHTLTDALLACGDVAAAREALGAALELSTREERPQALQRLRALARSAGDELGMRRYPASGPTPLVSLMPSRAARPRGESLAAVVREWSDAVCGE